MWSEGAQPKVWSRARGALALGGCLAATAAAAGCGVTEAHHNLVNGKEQFVAKCGACHTLSRAGTTGTTGPDLDAAFLRARQDGLGQSTFAGMVHGQILHPARNQQVDPLTHKLLPLMPPGLVKGDDAGDVAAYVAQAAGAGGKDPGRLATVGAQQAKGTAQEKNGVLDIPVSSAGGLAYQYANAQAQAGKVTIESKNDQAVGHDIAIEGNGVTAKGEVVQGGGVSKFSANLKPGTYTFYCTVPGHREGGMEGKLTVK